MMADRISSRIRQLTSLAEQALDTAQGNLASGDFRATVNRAYYAVFYAANAMLLTEGVERRRHSGVISAFRERFVKTGLIETEYSNIYGEALVTREDADYAVEIPIDLNMAETVLRQARCFVQRMLEYLARKGFSDESTE
jgi:uncharacterized protein (UPF0332 family)